MILWSHRGFVETPKDENTIYALENAFNLGYKHIEFDIWFLNNQLLTKHDAPTEVELENNTLVPLSNFMRRYGEKMQYWMDFKNLTADNIDAFLLLYKKIVDTTGIDYKTIYFAPHETNWDLSIGLHKKMQSYMKGINSMAIINCRDYNKAKLHEYYKTLQDNSIKNLSVEHKIVDKEFIEIFHDVNLFVWTINDTKEYKRLEGLGVKNICTDKITYKNL